MKEFLNLQMRARKSLGFLAYCPFQSLAKISFHQRSRALTRLRCTFPSA